MISTTELLLIFLVTLFVFGPSKLPMLARHIAKFINQLNDYRQRAKAFWQSQLDQQNLEDNTKRAEQADSEYDRT